jgi:glutamate-1-semialdehyde 2,1-aminomutase
VRAKGAYHGAAPWCVPRPAGTTDSDRANQILCDYNDVASLEAAVAEAGDDLAAIFAAPFKHDAFIDQAEPDPAYARRARELCDATGALLVVDDVRAACGSPATAPGRSWASSRTSPPGAVPGEWPWPLGAAGLGQGPQGGRLDLRHRPFCSRPRRWPPRSRPWDWCAIPTTWSVVRPGQRLRDGLAERAGAAGFALRQTGPVTCCLPVRGRPGPAQGLRFSSAMLEARRLCAPLVQHALRGHDRGRYRGPAGRRRGRVRRLEARRRRPAAHRCRPS